MIKKIFKKLVYRFRSDYTTEDLVSMGLVHGKNFLRMHGTIIDPSHCWLIHIGDNVTFAPRCHVLAHDASLVHHLGYARIGNVVIGNNVFVGADTVILPNVTIGDNVIIGANSTVSRSVPSGMVAVGSPAKVICTTEEFLDRNRKMMESCPVYGEDFTVRGKITPDKKRQQFENLMNGYGFVK